jgi:hypothetical protein
MSEVRGLNLTFLFFGFLPPLTATMQKGEYHISTALWYARNSKTVGTVLSYYSFIYIWLNL